MESTPRDPRRHRILGLPVHAVDLEGVVARAVRAVRDGRSLHVVVTNSHKCWLAHRDPDLRAVMEAADLVVPETSVVWASRFLGHEDLRPCWGVALAPRLLRAADEHGWSTFFLGARPDVVEAVVERVRTRYPGAPVAGWSHGYLEPDEADRVAERLAREPPHLLLVAMGSPRQERFMARLPRRRGPGVVVGVGGTFDVLAGRTRDAPSFVRGSGFEWLYRSLHSPRLFRRYARVNPWFVGHVLRERLTGRAPGMRPLKPVPPQGERRWDAAARTLHRWMADRDHAGWDPFDFLASPWLRAATLGTRWGGVAVIQLGRRLPFQLRPLLGVPRLRNAKGIALVVESLLRLDGAGRAPELRREAERLVDWLLDRQRPEGGWGYPFPWANRSFRVPADTPSSVVTAFVGGALLDAAEAGVGAPGLDAALDRAGTFLLQSLRRSAPEPEPFCFSYTPRDRRFVHNASVLAAALLARIGRRQGRRAALDAALLAARFTAQRQDERGLWTYGLAARDGWVDSFHTGYILLGLRTVAESIPGSGLEEAIRRGVTAWDRTFLVPPAVGHRPGRPWPVDAHALAHAVLTLLRLDDLVPDARTRAEALADWALDEMAAPEGRFHHRRHRFWTDRLPYMRWVQAWMLRALSELAARAAEGAAPGARGAGAASLAPGRDASGEG